MKKLFYFYILHSLMLGNIIYVPDSVATIQGGIDAASSGDTVLVSPGTYLENIDFEGKAILVTSFHLFDSDSIYIDLTNIEGDEVTSCVRFESNEDSSSILNGFTLRGGLGYLADPDGDGDSYNYGGGVYCAFSSPKLTNLNIVDNISPDGGGGGVFCYDADPIFRNIVIKQNSTSSVGGGLYCKAGSNPIFQNTVFEGNFATHGGGAYLRDGSLAEFYNCVFDGNFTSGTGGGITLKNDADIILDHVFFTNNSSDYYGGGIYCNNASPSLDHVTLTLNESDYGGGIYCRNGSEPSLVNTIVWDNIGAEIYFRGNEDENAMTISYSDIEAGTDGVTTNDNADVDWLEGNIEDDPLFCSTIEDNFSLVGNSPCAVAGMDSTYMGAYDVGCPPLHMGPTWHVTHDGDDLDDGSPETPFATIARALEQAIDGDSIIIYSGEYFEAIDFSGKEITIGSEFLITGELSSISQTIIKGDGPGSIIVFENDETENSRLVGLTISGGTSSHGGGIYISDAAPTLDHLIIQSNTADYGGGLYLNSAQPTLMEIEISGNSANYGGGIFIEECSFDISNIRINENMAYYGAGVYLHESNILLSEIMLVKNECFSEGGAVYSYQSNVELNNLTIAENISFNGGGAIFAFENSNIEIDRSILWDNSPQEIMYSPWGTFNYVSVSNSDVLNGLENVITNDNGDIQWDSTTFSQQPLFCNPDSTDYQLASNSPCLNVGQDSILIGAYGEGCTEILDNGPEVSPIVFSLNNSYPNPFNPQITIPFTLPKENMVLIEILDILGKRVSIVTNESWPAGQHSIVWNGEKFSSGIYIIRFKADKYEKSQRIVLLK